MEKFFGQTALAVSTGVLVFMNLVGNCLVLAVVLKNKFMRTAMNFLLFNLAVADIMVGVLALPVYVFGQLYTHPGGSLGDWLCRFITGSHLLYATGIVSAFTLSAVAYERYQVVVHPMTAKEKVTKKKAFIFITLVWVAAFSMWTVAWFAVVFDESTNQCALKSEFKIPIKIFAIAYASLVFGIPFISMLTLIWQGYLGTEKEPERSLLLQSVDYSPPCKKKNNIHACCCDYNFCHMLGNRCSYYPRTWGL